VQYRPINPVCRVCGVFLNSENFNEKIRLYSGLICISCKHDYESEWRSKHREECKDSRHRCFLKNPLKDREYMLKHDYGIDLKEYNILLQKQGGVCAICKIAKVGRKGVPHLFVDHNHNNNHVRGLLCDNCNKGLGHFKDSKDLLLRAIAYIGEDSYTD
jgi:hypothetical protein